jgi:putative ABC transport system permease protein
MVLLAWRNLTHNLFKLAVSMTGIAFAVMLVSMELGFRHALIDSTVELIRRLRADLFIIGAAKPTLASSEPFNRRVLDQALTVVGVDRAYPLYMDPRVAVLRNPSPSASRRGATARKIRVLAFDLDDLPRLLPEVADKVDALREPDTALFDSKSRPAYGLSSEVVSDLGRHPVRTDLARRPISLVGTFTLGTDFTTDGNLIMSDQNFLRYFPDRGLREPELRTVEMGLLQVAPGTDPRALARRLEGLLSDRGVKVLTKSEYLAREATFWNKRTPVGGIFWACAVLGLVVGGVICYQVLSSDIADHIAEYATLKAIGNSNGYLIGVVVAQALILSVGGFFPGIALSAVLYDELARWTGLLMVLSPGRAALVLGLDVLMCLASSLFAIRKVLSADPAGLF